MLLTWDELSKGRLLSPKLWKGLAPPSGGMQTFETPSGNPAIGFFDDFFKFSPTTGTDGYGIVDTGSGTVTQIASDGVTASTGMGICQLLTTAADADEAMLFWGNALDAPFKLTGGDFAFEARVKLTDITTSSHGLFVGIGSTDACATVHCITDADAIYASADFLGYQQLKGETTAVDGMYQVSGKTKVDGATAGFTGLDTLATIGVTNFIKLGFRFNAGPKNVRWFVDGVEQTAGLLKVAAADANEADSFPDGSYMTPIACLLNDGTTAANLELDWWACAQYV